MLIIDGALAVFNGLLVATGKFWCECVRGGVCCGGECRCDEGYCCNDTWHTDANPDDPCAEGEIFLRWGLDEECCGCVPETIFDGRVQENVNTADVVADLCCPGCDFFGIPFLNVDGTFIGCPGRCCDEVSCTNTLQADCDAGAAWYPSVCCEGTGCPRSCCTEDADGVSQCDTVDELRCTGVVDPEPCETACKGACCVDGELVEDSPKTQAECDDVDGCWWGAGSTECGTVGFCREPYDDDCCESVVSSAERLTFIGPRKRRCPELAACGVQVTVTVTTGQPVYIHGGLFGSPYEACTDIVTFLVCNDEFHVTPAPCSGNLDNLDIEVCWEDAVESESEILRFHCCQDTTYLLGNCDCDCVTTLLHEGGECTSNAVLQLRGDAIVDASGTGPLVLTGAITIAGQCVEKLTLAGTSTAANQVGAIPNSLSDLSVEKTGPGTWRLTEASSFGGRLNVLDGTIIAAVGVGQTGSGVFGGGANQDQLPLVGSTAVGAAGQAAILLESGVLIDRGLVIEPLGNGATQEAILGMASSSGTGTFGGGGEIWLGRDLTLQAAGGGTVRFSNDWKDSAGGGNPAVAFTIGSPGNSGTVELNSILPASITAVDVRYGTLRLDGGTETIDSGIPVTLGAAGVGVTLDLNGTTQPLESLSFGGSGSTVIGPGTLRMEGTAEIDVIGAGHTIAANVELADPTDVTVSPDGELTMSGVVSGTASLTVSGSGTLTLEGDISYTGQTSITGGTLVVEKEFAGSPDISLVTFTPTTLEIVFTTTPVSAATYQLLGGSTLQTYAAGAVTLTGAGGATGTYNSSTSTLTID